MKKIKRIITLILICFIITGCKETKYTVTFDTNGGTVLENVAIKKGDTIADIKTPTKDGYLFVNWLKDGIEYNVTTPVTEDISLTANWVEAPELLNEYQVTFNYGEETKIVKVKENDLIKEPTPPKKENHKFTGWYIGETKYDFTKPVQKDLLLTAQYEKEQLTISFDLDGGNGINSKTMNKGDKLSPPNNPTKFGHKFVKWTLDGQDFNFNEPVTKDITLKAVWKATEYVTVSFYVDGVLKKSEVIEKGTAIISVETPVKDGYTFKEWQYNGTTYDLNTEVTENISVEAVFNQN